MSEIISDNELLAALDRLDAQWTLISAARIRSLLQQDGFVVSEKRAKALKATRVQAATTSQPSMATSTLQQKGTKGTSGSKSKTELHSKPKADDDEILAAAMALAQRERQDMVRQGMADRTVFQRGDLVRIVGLLGSTHVNGTVGRVVRTPNGSNRLYTVENATNIWHCEPENLEQASPATQRAP